MVAIPQVITEDRASGAQFIDGSLKFDKTLNQYLKRTPSSAGNRKTWTISFWAKRTIMDNQFHTFMSVGTADGNEDTVSFDGNQLRIRYSTGSDFETAQLLRDTGWYHIVIAVDTTLSTSTDRIKYYINGTRVTNLSPNTQPGQNFDFRINNNQEHAIGKFLRYSPGDYDGHMSQYYFLDGQALGPENFAYTDPLTNTWRPKKFSGIFKIIPDNQLLYNVNTGDNGFDSGTSSRTYDATGRTFTTYSTPQTANPGGFGANSAHVYKSPDGASIDWVISTDSTDRYVWTSTDGINWTNTGVQDTDGSVVTVNTAWLAIAGGSNTTNATVTSSTAGYGSVVGHNSFYLPMDGNSPIGKDQSGNGNDWTPVHFGGSVELPKATGAIPVLNTNGGGTVAKRGARTDKKTYTVTASGGNYYIDGALKPTLNAYRGGSYTFDYTGASGHPFYLSSLQDGKWNSKAYSVSFDGTDDYLSLASSSDFALGTNDWTVEYFAYCESTTAYQRHFYLIGSSANQIEGIYADSSGIAFGKTNVFGETAVPNPLNQWNHYALVHDSTSMRLYINGSQVISSTNNFVDEDKSLHIGYSNSTFGGYFDGYISNFRVLKGTALYTSNFTPPQTTLTNITNTKLLCCQDSDATTAVVKPGTITTNGGAAATNSYSPFVYDNNHNNFGLNTATSNTTKITIPHLAADTLYYYCQNHSGMGSSINVTTDILKADPYAWKCMFAMASDMIDHSPEINVNSTATSFGDIHTTTLQPFRNFYGHSKKMETGGGFRIDMELTTAEANAKHKFDTNDFTLECWFYQDGGTTAWQSLFRSAAYNNSSLNADGIAFYGNGQTLWPYSVVSGSGQQWGQTGSVVPYKKWNHAAWTRQGDVNRIFANGILIKTFTNSNSWDNKGWEIGDVYTWNGGYQDARIYNGVAKYTESFVVPDTAPDILPDTPSGITGKTNLAKITDGAVSFDGSGDYLKVTGTSDVQFGTGAFTAECFVYANSLPGSGVYGIFDTGSAVNANRFSLVLYPNGKIYIDNNTNLLISTHVLSPNTWNHIAFVREGTGSNQAKLYINGVLSNQATINTDFNNDDLLIGKTIDNLGWNGYISNVRIIKGTALYTSNFTPPTELLTEVTNTKLLCCQSNTSAVVAAVAPGTFVNDGTNYSSGNQVTGSAGLTNADSIFNGHLRGSGIPTLNEGATVSLSSDNYILWTPTTGIPYNSKVEVYCYAPNGYNITNYYTFNGGTETSFVGGAANYNGNTWITIDTGAGTINSIKLRLTRSSGQSQVGWYGVRVDGTILINDYNGKSIAKYGNATATNFNPITDDINAIRGQETGYCTWNPLSNKGGTLSDGNLKYSHSSTANISATIMIPNSGKWFWEYDITRQVSGGVFGIGDGSGQHMRATDLSWWSKIYGYSPNGNKYEGTGGAAYGPTLSAGDLLGVAYNSDTRELRFYLNGVDKGVAFTTSSAFDYYPALHINNSDVVANFGQKPFKFPPPDGFQPLNLSNIQPEKVIARPDQYVGVSLWSGNGTSQNVTGLQHKPDFVWIKKRAGGSARSHQLFDSVRGVYKTLHSDGTSIEDTNTNRLTAFNQDGFAVGGDDGANGSGGTFVGWTWKAGGNKNTFNIDDVGYANASDVNMNAGALNSVTFDNSQNWTSQITGTQNGSYPFSNMFNNDGQATHAYPANGTRATFTPSPSFSNAKTVKVWYYAPTINADTFQLNGVNVGDQMTTTSGTLTKTFNVDGFTSWSWSKGVGGDDSGMLRIDVDGVQLVDSTVSVPNVPSIAPTGCSVGTKQGFSIVKFNSGTASGNQTIPHKLDNVPSFIVMKSTSNTYNWDIYHKGISNSKNGRLIFTGDAFSTTYAPFGGVDPTSSVFTFNQGFYGNNVDSVVYLWCDVPGLQKFGKYIGNASADGTFIELGFKPAIVWTKRTDAGSNWLIHDSARDPSNPVYGTLWGNLNNTEGTTNICIDMTSTGFKHRNADGGTANNHLGAEYIYCAWAEAPIVNLYGGQSNAR